MFNDQSEPVLLSIVLNAVESLQKCISADSQYPFSIDEILDVTADDDDIQRIDASAHYRSIIINRMEKKTDMIKSNETLIDLTDDDEISFNQLEWSVKDITTNKIRPPRLYEFLLLLLNNIRYISYASWLNKNDGLFKIHKPDKVIKLWEIVKIRHSNTKMDFDKFTRGIRNNYKDGRMVATYKKHTYRFVVKK